MTFRHRRGRGLWDSRAGQNFQTPGSLKHIYSAAKMHAFHTCLARIESVENRVLLYEYLQLRAKAVHSVCNLSDTFAEKV